MVCPGVIVEIVVNGVLRTLWIIVGKSKINCAKLKNKGKS